ncbi:MAG: CapA family protein [Clostridiales bacterium]|nr:CapA family protein [Clostridiales bacterium]
MRILFLGDVCPTEDYRKLFDDKSGKSLFNNTVELINQSDFAVCNFECPATLSGNAIKKCGPTLKAKPEDLEMLKNVGINAVSLANNHTLDLGVQGFIDTVSVCKQNGIDYFGTILNGKETDCLVLEKDGERVTVFSFAEEEFNYSKKAKTGAIHFDPYESLDKIANAKRVGKVVVLYHGGIEYLRTPTPLLQKKCRKMVEKGADLVLCQHSHIIGTTEEYNGGFILYGQGNSVFGVRENSNTWNEGLAVTFDTENGVYLELIKATKNGIEKATETETLDKLKNIKELSDKMTDEFIELEWQKFCKAKQANYYPMVFGKGRIYNKLNRMLKNKLADKFIGKKKKMTTMNLIRCDAHREVVTTLLENDYDKYQK